MQDQPRKHMDALCDYLERHQHNLVIDADTHATDTIRYPRRQSPHYYHGRPISAEDLITEMDLASISMSNIWQNPAATLYPGTADANFEALLEANRYIQHAALQFPQRFIASGWTDPQACGIANACRIATHCVNDFGFLIVKLNPAQNRFPIDSPAVLEVVDHIVSLGAIPAFHYGADSIYTPAQGLETIAQRHPNHPILAVHMGGGGAGYVEAESLYNESRDLGLRQPNIHYILSAIRDTHIESNLIAYQQANQSHRLFCASDAPYGRMSWNFGGFRALFKSLDFDTQTTQGHLGQYFAKFILDGYQRLLNQA